MFFIGKINGEQKPSKRFEKKNENIE